MKFLDLPHSSLNDVDVKRKTLSGTYNSTKSTCAECFNLRVRNESLRRDRRELVQKVARLQAELAASDLRVRELEKQVPSESAENKLAPLIAAIGRGGRKGKPAARGRR
jgi:septal ring factor EnvC (AmiA/AmiB activator)